VNRTRTFKFIGNIKFHVNVAFERGKTQKNSEIEVIILVVTYGFVHADDIFQALSE
jgi:hypothetical protein